MHIQSEQYYDSLSLNDSKLQKHTLSTNFYHNSDNYLSSPIKDIEQKSQNTLPQLLTSSRTEVSQNSIYQLPLEKQIISITERFDKIKRILVEYSQHQSNIHQRRIQLKYFPIDWEQIPMDYSNKVSIVEDLRGFVTQFQQQGFSTHLQQVVQNKFQEYYLQRHYGGLKCQFNGLHIQERGQQEHKPQQKKQPCHSFQSLNQSSAKSQSQSYSYCNIKSIKQKKLEDKSIISKIAGFVSLVNDSKISFQEDCCQTLQQNWQFYVQVPRIIQVQIPVIIYKIKEVVINYDESDLLSPYNNIDDIINRYSLPYDDLYVEAGNKHQMEINLEPLQKITQENEPKEEICQYDDFAINPCGSIMLDSNVNQQQKDETQVELSYSDFPDQSLRLPLDSYAQLSSYLTNQNDNVGQNQAKEKKISCSNENIMISKKVVSYSIVQKFQQSERILNEENMQLKQSILSLQIKFNEFQKQKVNLEAINKKLVYRLQEQIQQGEYLNNKLNQLDAELLQQKVSSLTYLNQAKDRKIQSYTQLLQAKNLQMLNEKETLEKLTISLQKAEYIINKKQEEVTLLTKKLQQTQKELKELNVFESQFIQITEKAQSELKKMIQKLEIQRDQLTTALRQFQNRQQNDGINLKYQQAQSIHKLFQTQEQIHNSQLSQIDKKYENIIKSYQEQISCLKNQLKDTQNRLIMDIKDTVDFYSMKMLAKDEEIMRMRQQGSQKDIQKEKKVTKQLMMIIATSESKFNKEKQFNQELNRQITKKQTQLQQYQLQMKYTHQLIEILSQKFEKLIVQNENLKASFQQQKNQAKSSTVNQASQPIINAIQLQKLKKVNSKLKRYTKSLQQQLISISGMSRCQSHQFILRKITEQRDYYLQLFTGTIV